MYKQLDKIKSPQDLKNLDLNETIELADEIREFLIKSITKTGGHLASNLGIVEITLAIYKVFSAPQDKIIFDVGHQSYVSKILTGRKNCFDFLRMENGISGFPKITESEFDAFGTGHSSTSLSAALGIARANKILGKNDYTVAVIGDGAFSGGLVYEALNNCEKDLNLIVILNENEMSISRNVGNMARLISKIRSKENYFRIKSTIQYILEKIPFVGSGLIKLVRKFKRILKNAIFSANFVENFGFNYYGPVDGNDYLTVERLLKQAKKRGGNAFIHIKTKKGKGYLPAEDNPSKYHMVKPMDSVSSDRTFSSVFGDIMCDTAKDNKKICLITAAMQDGTGLTDFFKQYPNQAFDVGIAEGHAATFSAGLSISGLIPVFAVYSSFFQRSYDNFLHDIALQNLHSIFAIDRAGLSPDDGATHHGIFDVSIFSSIKNVVVYSPISYKSLAAAFRYSLSAGEGIFAVRYHKGFENTDGLTQIEQFIYYAGDLQSEYVIITYGRIFSEALDAMKLLRNDGINCFVLVFEKLTPYSDTLQNVIKYCSSVKGILILEEGIESGGFGQNLLMYINKFKAFSATVDILAIPGEVPGHANFETLYRQCGICKDDIIRTIKGRLK